jgi:hypothetical protein
MRAIVTDEQRRNRPKVGLPEGPGRFRSGDCVVRRSHSPRYAPSATAALLPQVHVARRRASRLVGAPKSPRPNRVLFTQASIAPENAINYHKIIQMSWVETRGTKESHVDIGLVSPPW